MALVTPWVRDPAAPAAPAALADLEALEARDRADLVDQVDLTDLGVRDPAGLVGPEDMNRVDPAVMEDMGRADLASLRALADLASLGVRGRVGLEAMNRVGLEGLAVRERALTARDPRGLEARDLNPGRAQLDPMPTALDRAQPGRMRVLPGRAQLDLM